MTSITTFWFRDSSDYQAFWFDKSVDDEVREKFGHLVDNPELLSEFSELEKIIVLDQFTRNIYRDNHRKNDHLALPIALDIVRNNRDLLYPFHQRIFILLVLRHARQTPLLDLVLQKLESYDETEKNSKLYMMYLSQTIADYAKVTDTICSDQLTSFDLTTDIFDPESPDIMRCMEAKHIIDSPLVYSVKKYLEEYKIKKVGISLSGGVDSMVLLHICQSLGYDVVAMHVNYNNRPESILEQRFLQYYCYVHKVPLYYRSITHIRRGFYDRNEYEEHTKNIRFALYKFVNPDCISLGHHKGDVMENCLTNMFRGKDITDLNGMSVMSVQNDTRLFRPMLDHFKDDILSIATKYYIPYFKNTTPTWSCRGVMREQIIPLIVNQFGSGTLQNIINVGDQSQKMNMHFNQLINEIKITRCKYGLIISKETLNRVPDFLQKKAWIHILHSNGYRMISNTNLNQISSYKGNHLLTLSNKLFYTETAQNDIILIQKFPELSSEKEINLEDEKSEYYEGWKISVSSKPSTIGVTIYDLINGEFYLRVPNTFRISSKGFEKKDKMRQQYTGLSHEHLREYVPKVHTCSESSSTKVLTKVIHLEKL